MSRRSQKRNKFAKKPTAEYTTSLDTVTEDEALVTTVSTGQGQHASVLASKSMQKASKRGRRRKAKRSAAPSTVRLTGNEVSDAFKALGREITLRTKTVLTFHLELLVEAIDAGDDDDKHEELACIELCLQHACRRRPLTLVVVTAFREILHHAPAGIIRGAIHAIGDYMSESEDSTSDASMPDASAP